jgi:hypothetical protein
MMTHFRTLEHPAPHAAARGLQRVSHDYFHFILISSTSLTYLYYVSTRRAHFQRGLHRRFVSTSSRRLTLIPNGELQFVKRKFNRLLVGVSNKKHQQHKQQVQFPSTKTNHFNIARINNSTLRARRAIQSISQAHTRGRTKKQILFHKIKIKNFQQVRHLGEGRRCNPATIYENDEILNIERIKSIKSIKKIKIFSLHRINIV